MTSNSDELEGREKLEDKKATNKKSSDGFKIELVKIGYLEENTSGSAEYVCSVCPE